MCPCATALKITNNCVWGGQHLRIKCWIVDDWWGYRPYFISISRMHLASCQGNSWSMHPQNMHSLQDLLPWLRWNVFYFLSGRGTFLILETILVHPSRNLFLSWWVINFVMVQRCQLLYECLNLHPLQYMLNTDPTGQRVWSDALCGYLNEKNELELRSLDM